MANNKRERFSSRSATILTMMGVAIGLGNLWRFPYMMGSHGGSAFLFVYLFFVLVFGVPAIMAEWLLGRSTRSGPIGAFTVALGKPWGTLIGGLLTIAVLIANSYYLVVVAMVAYSAWFSGTVGFNADSVVRYSSEDLANGWLVASIAIFLLVVALSIICIGFRRGVQRISQWFVPFFGLVVVYLIFHSFSLPGAGVRFAEFLRPDFSALTAVNVFAAMGQAIFSLSLGGTFFVIYGSYLRDEEKIPGSALFTALGDVGAALLASLFLIPAMLVLEIDLAQGPGLIFETLPRLFMQLPGGRVVGTLFLIAFAMMAFLSSMAALQVGVGTIRDFFGWKKLHVIAGIGLFEVLLIVLTAFRQDLIGPMDLIFGSGMQCLGCLIACLAVGWGLGRVAVQKQLFGMNKNVLGSIFLFWIRWVVPLGILVVLVVATDIGQAIVGFVLP